MREARDKLSAEIEGKTYDEILRWPRSCRYMDPVLRQLAEKATQQAAAADGATALAGSQHSARMESWLDLR